MTLMQNEEVVVILEKLIRAHLELAARADDRRRAACLGCRLDPVPDLVFIGQKVKVVGIDRDRGRTRADLEIGARM